VTEAARRQFDVEWNRTRRDYPLQTCLHELVEAQVARTPDAEATRFENEPLSYAELNRRANRLARHLRAAGAGPEVPVVVCMQRSNELVVALLAVLKSGSAYVPLEPSYPVERKSFVLEDTGAELLLTQERLVATLPPGRYRTISVDACSNELSGHDHTDLRVPVSAANLAYVIYTSGSTGRPKGAMNPHRGVVNRLLWMQETFVLDGEDRILQKTPFSFDVSVWEFFWPLIAGARLVMARPEGHRDREYLAQTIADDGITHVHFVPSMLREFLDASGLERCRVLRRVLCSGEALTPDLLQRFASRMPAAVELHNLYGPTEAAVDVTWWPCDRGAPGRVPIGHPIANTRTYVLDANLRPVGPGQPGELHIGGVQVGRGYWRRPELTAERFIPDPFGDEPSARMYRTGDLCRHDGQGALEYLGRLDFQVKVRGFRIEPGEIEEALARHPAVHQAVVVARPDATGETGLVGYVAARDEGTTRAELRGWLRERLPEFMVPSRLVVLERLPVTESGKIDRRSLPDPAQAPGADAGWGGPPRTPTEEVVARIFEEVLGYPRIDRLEDFFELGGHSLKAMRVISRVREALRVELPQGSLFEAATVAGVAAQVDAAVEAGAQVQWPAIRPVPRGGPLPVSFPQEQAWFMQQLEPTSLAYQSQAVLRFTGSLQVEALRRALEEMVRRHEIFRTTFPAVGGQPVQEVHAPWRVELPVEDLSGLPRESRELEARRLVDEEVRRLLDITRLPLVRWRLLRLAPEEHWMVHVEHHLIHDGWSFTVFARELSAIYRACVSGTPSPLPEPVLQFADFAAWQRHALEGPQGEAQRTYWRNKLAGAPPLLDLPTDHPRPPQLGFRGRAPRFELPPDLFESLSRFSRAHGTTLFMTMMAAFAALLQRYTGQDELCVGSGVANRRWRETEALLGMIVNVVTLRIDASGDPRLRELLRRVRQTTLEAYAHQDLPFGSVVQALNPDRTLSHAPLYQVLFSFHDSPLDVLDLGGVALSVQEAVSNGSAKFDMNVIVVPRSERFTGEAAPERHGMVVVWEYNTDLYEPATIDRMAGQYRRLLEALVADPERRISQVPLAPPEERHRLLALGRRPATTEPTGTVHTLFEEQVARSPERVALLSTEGSWSYRELNERADRLARVLRDHGVGAEVRVGVGLERSASAVVAFLAILKAGGAYVPLDPSYPAERLAWMAADSGIRVLITETRLRGPFSALECPVVCLDRPLAPASAEPSPGPCAGPEDLAYVIYTSGSTGTPKGACIPHRAVVRLVRDQDYASFEDEVFLLFAPLSFDASTFEIWGPLLNGGRLVVMPPGPTSLEDLARVVADRGVTTLWLTAGLFQEVVDWRVEALTGLRQLLAGGDVLSVAHAERVLRTLGNCRLVNGYGPTESTTFTTCHVVADEDLAAGRIPIGRPIANTDVYILDDGLEPAAVGVPAELYIGGAGLARCYHDRPELTAERFVPNPHGVPGSRLYRTGDRVRWRQDGCVEFLGRRDGQVKLRGFRIEPGEIEFVLRGHPDVSDAAVVVQADPSGERLLVAYVVVAGARRAEQQVLDWVRDRLPGYMVPAHIVALDRLPLTPNGKLDRDALPAPAEVRRDGADEPPRGAMESAIAAVFASVLGRDQIGRAQSFFALGGHSLKAARVLSRVNEAWGVQLPLRVLFDSPTVAGLAGAIEAARAGDASVGAAAMPLAPSRKRGLVRTDAGNPDRPPTGGGAP
jgi:amino acid adenylation domain-containing protein